MSALYDQNCRAEGGCRTIGGMRLVGLAVVLGLCGAVACKSGSEASTAPDPAAAKAQQDLMKRRDALLEQRERLETARQQIVEQIQKTEASGGDTKALAKQRDDLTGQIEGQSRSEERRVG